MKKITLFIALFIYLTSANAICGLFNSTCKFDSNKYSEFANQMMLAIQTAESVYASYYPNINSNDIPNIPLKHPINGATTIGDFLATSPEKDFIDNAYITEFKDGTVLVQNDPSPVSKAPNGMYIFTNTPGGRCQFMGLKTDAGLEPIDSKDNASYHCLDPYIDALKSYNGTLNANKEYQQLDATCPKILASANKYLKGRYNQCLENYDNTTCIQFFQRDQAGYSDTHYDYARCVAANPMQTLVPAILQ
jgi:hypothetical protein